MILLAIALQAFTTPGNTQVIADTQAPPPVLPVPAVPAISVPATAPFIDGSQAYIWSPNNASGQTVTFRSVFTAPVPLFTALLPVAATYAYAGNETVTVSGTIEFLNAAGLVVLTASLFGPDSNGGNPDNVATAFGTAHLSATLLATSMRVTVDATVTAPVTLPYAPANTGRYLGQLTVQTVV